MKMTRIMAVAVLVAASGLVLAQQAGTKRTELQRHDLSVGGREVVQMRVEVDPGQGIPRHTHYGEEMIYVLAGTLEGQLEGQAPVTLKAGDVFFVPAGKVHAARNNGAGEATVLTTYVVEKGKPLTTVAK